MRERGCYFARRIDVYRVKPENLQEDGEKSFPDFSSNVTRM